MCWHKSCKPRSLAAVDTYLAKTPLVIRTTNEQGSVHSALSYKSTSNLNNYLTRHSSLLMERFSLYGFMNIDNISTWKIGRFVCRSPEVIVDYCENRVLVTDACPGRCGPGQRTASSVI